MQESFERQVTRGRKSMAMHMVEKVTTAPIVDPVLNVMMVWMLPLRFYYCKAIAVTFDAQVTV